MDPFMHFLAQCEDDLARIAWFSRSEHAHDDVRQQAWLEAHDLAEERGTPPAYLDKAFQQEVLRRLRRQLVDRDRKLRYATRLDHGFDGDDVAFARHLTEHVGVAAIPPSAFFDDPRTRVPYVRFVFCKRPEVLAEAIRRLTRGLGG